MTPFTSPNVIIADGDYIDRVAFNLTVNFERMIGRRIPPADMARWLECIALDGGMRPYAPASVPGSPSASVAGGFPAGTPVTVTQVVLVHDAARQRMENFAPDSYASALDGKAFKGPLGEFQICCTSPEGFTSVDALLLDTLGLALQSEQVHRLMVVPSEKGIDAVRRMLGQSIRDDREPAVTLFSMQPTTGQHFMHELLGYSLMAALGVKSSELQSADATWS